MKMDRKDNWLNSCEWKTKKPERCGDKAMFGAHGNANSVVTDKIGRGLSNIEGCEEVTLSKENTDVVVVATSEEEVQDSA